MMSVQSIDWIISKSLFFFAFVFSITFTGMVQALIARWMGDETPERHGFTEFNPFVHLSFLDIVFFFIPFIELMIGNPIPIDTRSIKIDKKPLRLAVVFCSRFITYLTLAIVALLVNALLCSGTVAAATAGHAPLGKIMVNRESLSSITYVLCLFCTVMALINTFLAAFSAIREGAYGIVLYRFEKDPRLMEYANLVLVFGVLFLLIFFWQPIVGVFSWIVENVVTGLLSLLGI